MITKKQRVQYIHPVWKYNKKYIKIDKLGRVSWKKKSKKAITIKLKWQKRWYKVKVRVR
jgi:hypothetical protein